MTKPELLAIVPAYNEERRVGAVVAGLRKCGLTMGHPLVEIIVHKVVWFYDKVFRTDVDMDSERGMREEEAY